MKFGIAHKLWAVCLAFGFPIAVMFVLMSKRGSARERRDECQAT